MALALDIAGIVIIAVILWEVFADLFHPTGRAAMSDWLGRHLFQAFKRRPALLPLAGPVVLVSVIAAWIGALVVGFALLYFAGYPENFRTSTGAIPPASGRLATAIYFSFETLVTLGYGDLVPHGAFARGVSTFEALVGFGLLTASVSSIVLLYPALARMRLLARGVSHLVAAEQAIGTPLVGTDAHAVLLELAREVAHARIDLMHFPIVYYFVTADANASTAKWIGDVSRFANEARASQHPAHIRLAGAALDRALDDLAALLENRFLHTCSDNRGQIFRAFARDHLPQG